MTGRRFIGEKMWNGASLFHGIVYARYSRFGIVVLEKNLLRLKRIVALEKNLLKLLRIVVLEENQGRREKRAWGRSIGGCL